MCLSDSLWLENFNIGPHLDSLRLEEAYVVAGAVEHLDGEHEVFALVRVRDEERFGRGVMATFQVELLHFLIRLTDPDEGTSLKVLLLGGRGVV